MNPPNVAAEPSDALKEKMRMGISERLQVLDEVDKKIYEVMEFVKEIIHNLDKDKQITRNKMDEAAKKYSKTLDEDIVRVINEQLIYMEQLCVGAEHQGSMFKIQNRTKTSKLVLKMLHDELHAMRNPDEIPQVPDVEMDTSPNSAES